MSEKMTNPRTARICEACSNLVTIAERCPLCDGATAEHRQRGQAQGYCLDCADGPFPLEEMHLVTWEEDPYTQGDDGDLSCVCAECREEKREEEREAE